MVKLAIVGVFVVACDGGGSAVDVCGDTIVDPGETCDDGNDIAGDGCTACVIEPRCGDGVLDHITGEQCDDGNTLGGDGCSASCQLEVPDGRTITASWSFKHLSNNQTLGCPAGFNTVVVVSDSGAEQIADLFDCAALTGTTAPMRATDYAVHIVVVANPGGESYASSTGEVIDLTVANGAFNTTIYNDAGYFELVWMLRGAVTNNALTCTEAGVTAIAVAVSGGTTTTLPCGDHIGVTLAQPAGTHAVSVSALDGQQQMIGVAPSLLDQPIQLPNGFTQLVPFTIAIDNQ